MSYVSETRTIWRAQCDDCGLFYVDGESPDRDGTWWLERQAVAEHVEDGSEYGGDWLTHENGLYCTGCTRWCEECDERKPAKLMHDPKARWGLCLSHPSVVAS